MAESVSQNVKLDMAASDVYRVNPMDRDAGGRSRDEGFERFMKRRKPGQEEKGKDEPLPDEPASPRPVPEDGVTLSDSARAALEGGGFALAVKGGVDEPKPADLPGATPPDPNQLPPGTHVNLTA